MFILILKLFTLQTKKVISVIDSKIKRIKNQNALSYGNSIRKVLSAHSESLENDEDEEEEEEEEDDDDDDENREMKSMGYDSNLEDDTYLSMYFGIRRIRA